MEQLTDPNREFLFYTDGERNTYPHFNTCGGRPLAIWVLISNRITTAQHYNASPLTSKPSQPLRTPKIFTTCPPNPVRKQTKNLHCLLPISYDPSNPPSLFILLISLENIICLLIIYLCAPDSKKGI